MEPTTKKWKTEKLKCKNGYAEKYRSAVRESVKKRKAMVGRICRKEGCKPGMKERWGDGIVIIISIKVSCIMTV